MIDTPLSPTRPSLRPIVKWVGGKSRIVPQLLPLLPGNVRELRHVEPFAGGAALFFSLRPVRALLGDINPSLCGMYSAVRDDVEAVIAVLAELARSHSAERYYEIRRVYNEALLARCLSPAQAARFIYLNKTCFNGLHRLNRKGQFNAPLGDKRAPWVLQPQCLRAASEELQRVELRARSFEELLYELGEGDFVYCDPPYDANGASRGFVHYNAVPFDSSAQDRLCEVFSELDRRGCKVMLSNSDTTANWRRYGDFNIQTVEAPRAVNSDGRGRGLVRELVVRNYFA